MTKPPWCPFASFHSQSLSLRHKTHNEKHIQSICRPSSTTSLWYIHRPLYTAMSKTYISVIWTHPKNRSFHFGWWFTQRVSVDFLSRGILELEHQVVGDLTCASHFRDEGRAYGMTAPRQQQVPSMRCHAGESQDNKGRPNTEWKGHLHAPMPGEPSLWPEAFPCPWIWFIIST